MASRCRLRHPYLAENWASSPSAYMHHAWIIRAQNEDKVIKRETPPSLRSNTHSKPIISFSFSFCHLRSQEATAGRDRRKHPAASPACSSTSRRHPLHQQPSPSATSSPKSATGCVSRRPPSPPTVATGGIPCNRRHPHPSLPIGPIPSRDCEGHEGAAIGVGAVAPSHSHPRSEPATPRFPIHLFQSVQSATVFCQSNPEGLNTNRANNHDATRNQIEKVMNMYRFELRYEFPYTWYVDDSIRQKKSRDCDDDDDDDDDFVDTPQESMDSD
ncbi:hypothetical protein LXL04_038796 [Taraxacum kok-saghyz]